MKKINKNTKKRIPTTKNVKKKRARTENYSVYLYRVLKQVQPGLSISSRAMSIMDSFMVHMKDHIAAEAGRLVRYTRRSTLTARDLMFAARLLLPGGLGLHAVGEGNKAIRSFMGSNVRTHIIGPSAAGHILTLETTSDPEAPSTSGNKGEVTSRHSDPSGSIELDDAAGTSMMEFSTTISTNDTTSSEPRTLPCSIESEDLNLRILEYSSTTGMDSSSLSKPRAPPCSRRSEGLPSTSGTVVPSSPSDAAASNSTGLKLCNIM